MSWIFFPSIVYKQLGNKAVQLQDQSYSYFLLCTSCCSKTRLIFFYASHCAVFTKIRLILNFFSTPLSLLSLSLFYFISVNKTTVTCKIQFRIIFHLERFRPFLPSPTSFHIEIISHSQRLEIRSFMQQFCKINILKGPKEGKVSYFWHKSSQQNRQ